MFAREKARHERSFLPPLRTAEARAPAASAEPSSLPADRAAFRYLWPGPDAFEGADWQLSEDRQWRVRAMPESRDALARDSRWPAFFPCGLCIVTTLADGVPVVEKVVGASVVNRFPYVVALSFCREPLSERHYARNTFLAAALASRRVAIQFLMPGRPLSGLLKALTQVPEDAPLRRFASAGLATRPAVTSAIPVFEQAYLVYEGRLVKPGRDFAGGAINRQPFIDVGSHRVLMFEVETISLRDDIASGAAPLHWRSLPVWRGGPPAVPHDARLAQRRRVVLDRLNYVKPYETDYVFPTARTVAFEADEHAHGHAVKHLPPLAEDQVEVDNNRARWPCFFPSSVGIIAVDLAGGGSNVLACGSTAVVARHPLTLAVSLAYVRTNDRYRPRASLDHLLAARRFGCAVPVHRPDIIETIVYIGNVSAVDDSAKVANSGLTPVRLGATPGFAELPIHFDCRVVGQHRLGTHMLILGEVEQLFVRHDLDHARPFEWCPWPGSIAP
jgi:flavin reductase (DIM6/NTAB) family NADH-FMN oxidoreductase RutF